MNTKKAIGSIVLATTLALVNPMPTASQDFNTDNEDIRLDYSQQENDIYEQLLKHHNEDTNLADMGVAHMFFYQDVEEVVDDRQESVLVVVDNIADLPVPHEYVDGYIKGDCIGNFQATGYNLSVQSCGKPRSHKNYGKTASGYSLKGHSRTSTMTIATDPRVIPLGTKVYVEFPETHSHLSGVYTSRDTGGAIKGNIVDVFMGEGTSTKEVRSQIGRQNVKLYSVK